MVEEIVLLLKRLADVHTQDKKRRMPSWWTIWIWSSTGLDLTKILVNIMR
jgi:hypothetical protein